MSVSIEKRILMDAENRAARQSLRDRVYGKSPGVCWYCGFSINHKNRTMDHVLPRAKGGEDTYENLVPCCKDCNRLKSNGTIEFLRKKLRWVLSGMPEFSHEQVQYLEQEHGISLDPDTVRFWFEQNK